MGILLNPKHEKFAQMIANGQKVLAAYVLVGYRKHNQNACRLAQHDDIRARVSEILMKKDDAMSRVTARAANALAIDKKWVMQELVSLAADAKEFGDRGAAVRSLELVGKEMGMFINRSVSVDISADFANLDNAEAILAAVAKELGDDTAATLRALVAPRQAAKPMRTIEHDPGETIDAESPDEPEDPTL